MTAFVTYAQNFEDLMLWRALRDVRQGFYIDVGAADPDEDSVTRAFYDRGWHGINVEPSPEHFEALLAARPRDITLRCLVSASSGDAKLHHFAETGLSTTNETFAQRHIAEGRDEDILSLPMVSLAQICRRHAPGAIHFLKIDVEGAEAEVLRGADFAAFRPWIVLAEATEPGSQIENWSGWDGLLTAADYRFAWFDGLNRFYIAGEQWEARCHAFATPPNVFDQWSKPLGKAERQKLERLAAVAEADLASAREEAAALHLQLAESQRAVAAHRQGLTLANAESRAARTEADRLHAALAIGRTELDRLHAVLVAERAEMERLRADLTGQRRARDEAAAALAAVYASRSWRLAAPIRRIGSLLRPIARGLKRVARGALYLAFRMAARAPGRRTASTLLRRLLPGPHAALYARYTRQRSVLTSASPVEQGETQMSPEPSSQPSPNPSPQPGPAAQPAISAEESRMLLRLRAQTGPP